MKISQRGGFVLGMVVGLLIGLALALSVALYITKAPVPFIDKVPQRTAEHDRAETERNRQWNPNAALGSKNPPAGATEAPPPDALPAPVFPDGPPRDPAAILSGATTGATTTATPPTDAIPPTTNAPPRSTAAALEPFVYFVQAGAFARNQDAEQQRARLALMGLTAKITEREQAGRTVYRVRMGPYPAREAADNLLQRLQSQAIDSQIVRVERP